MCYSDGSLGTELEQKHSSSPIVMVKSPFDLINGIAVLRKKGRKKISLSDVSDRLRLGVVKYLDCELTSRSSPS